LLLFLYVTEEAGRKYVRDMPWPPAAECNMITKKIKNKGGRSGLLSKPGQLGTVLRSTGSNTLRSMQSSASGRMEHSIKRHA